MEKKYTYSAFISYSSENKRIAKALWRKLEHYRYPVVLQKQHENVPKKLHVFLDRGDISPGGTVEKALSRELVDSKKLIVICSPASAISSYVEFEVKSFFEIGHTADDVIPYIIAGEVNKNSPKNCYVPSLFGKEDKDTVNGVSVIRDGKFKAFVGILASLGDLKFDTIYKREKIRKRNNIIIKAILFLFIFFIIGFSIFQWKNAKRNQAYNYFVKANELYENGNSSYALAYYKKSLQMDNNPVVRDKVYSIITNDSWLVEKNEVTPIYEDIIDYDECEEISKQLGVENGWGVARDLPVFEKLGLLEISEDRKHIVFKDTEMIKVLDFKNNIIVYQDKLEKDCIYKKCMIKDNYFFYLQEKVWNKGYILKRINLDTKQTFELSENYSLLGYCLSFDGQFLTTLTENVLSVITVYDIKNNKIQWQRRENSNCLEVLSSPDNIHFVYKMESNFDDTSEIIINNYYDECDVKSIQIEAIPNNVIENIPKNIIKFSTDGSKIGILTNGKLCIYNVKDGTKITNSRLFIKQIRDFRFTTFNTIQLSFYGSDIIEEFSLIINSSNSEKIKTNIDLPYIIMDTIRLKNNYICCLLFTENGIYLELRNQNKSERNYSVKLNDDVSDYTYYSSTFLCTNDSQDSLFVGVNFPKGEFFKDYTVDCSIENKEKGKVIDVYSLDFDNNESITFKKRIICENYIIDIPIFIKNNAILFCYDERKSETILYYMDLLDEKLKSPLISSYSLGMHYDYKVIENKFLYYISHNSNGDYLQKDNIEKVAKDSGFVLSEETNPLIDRKLTIDNHGNIYIYSNYSSEVSVFNSKGEQINSIEAVNDVQLLSVDNNCKLMGMAFESYNQVKEGIEVVNLKDNSINFRADYGKKDKVKFSKIAFSEDSTKLYVSGSYLSKKNEDSGFKLGFFDIWDINTGSKLSSVSNENIGEIFDFEIENEKAYIYTRKGTVIKYLFDTSKETLKELKSDALYQVLGGWTLNKNGVPELITKEIDEHGNLYSWLTTPKEERTIHPMSSVLLSDVENDY